MLLFISTPAYILLIYAVNIRNIFLLTAEDNKIVLIMHVLLLFVNAFGLALVWFRRAKTVHEIQRYHFGVVFVVYMVWIFATIFFIVTVIKTGGHPILIFLGILSWSSSFLFPPRVLVVTHIILVGSLWTIMATFALPTDNARFTSEALIASFTTSVVLVVSGTVLFKTTVEAFRQQKIVEEERNTISRLNLETEALNQELFHRQDILEEQAREIEIINTQLQEQNQTLFDLNIEKNELMEIVAHDLKNPIGAVRSFAELMQEGYVLPEDIPSTSEKIAQTANRMLDLVTNLLDINRLESGAAQFTIVKIDTLPIVKTIVENYRSQAAQKNISIYLASETAQTRVLADEQALQQVLDNILSNAVKYSPHGKNVFVRIKASIDAVRVEIQDEGEGISPDDMKKLFGKFARLTARPTGGEHSTGLGLSIVKKMMEAMNGKVWCESEVGDGLPTGATFIVELPMATT